MRIKLQKLTVQNFKVFQNDEFDFTDVTKIAGENGAGKTTILCAYTWLLFNTDYSLRDNPKIRREINHVPVDDMDVFVEAVINMDGKEVIVKKVQKRKWNKEHTSYSDDNTYFINDVPKTLRDFNEYFKIDMKTFEICSNVNAFLAKKVKEMRDFLFSLPGDISDLDVAGKFDDLQPLVELLEKYGLDEIVAMNKASKAKLQKEINEMPGRIDEVSRSIVDIDVSDLELHRNDLKKQIAEIEKKYEDSESMLKEYDQTYVEIIRIKSEMDKMFEKASEGLHQERRSIKSRMDGASNGFKNSHCNIKNCESDIGRVNATIARNEKEKVRLQNSWKEEKAKAFIEFDEFDELPTFDNHALTCPTCGQELTEELKNQKITHYEERKKQHKLDYENSRKLFETKKEERLAEIAKQGNALVEGLKKDKLELEQLESQLKQMKEDAIQFNKEKSLAIAELENLPQSVDLSDNKEYEALQQQCSELEDSLRNMNTGADYRSQLKSNLFGSREELSSVETKIASADTTVKKERLAELKKKHLDMEQSKADCERILFLVDELDRHKNELLVSDINRHFTYVKWKLFENSKGGTYKSICVPTIDDFDYKDTTNEGRDFLIALDICNSIQKIKDMNCPVFLDRCAELDSKSTEKLLDMMDCQMILLSVSEDVELRIEVA